MIPGVIASHNRPLLYTADWYVDARRYSGTGDLLDLSGNGNHFVPGAGAAAPLWLPYDGEPYVYFPAVATNSLYTLDAPGLNVTGDVLDLRTSWALNDWTSGSYQCLVEKGADDSYGLFVSGTGTLQINLKATGSGVFNAQSTAPVTLPDGVRGWVRATRSAVTGIIRFYQSVDGTTWTQVGTDVAAATGVLVDGTRPLFLGEREGGSLMALGKFYSLEVYSDGVPVCGLDAADIASPYQTAPGLNGETWVLARASLGLRLVAVDRPMFAIHTNTFLRADNDGPEIQITTGPLTVVLASRHPVTPSVAQAYLTHKGALGTTGTNAGWALRSSLSFGTIRAELSSTVPPGDTVTASSGVVADGRLITTVMTRGDGSGLVKLYTNDNLNTVADQSKDLSTTALMRVGSTGTGGNDAEMEFLGAALWNRALTAAEVAQVQEEFQIAA